jgi:SAM-dependent methyltransferase
MFGAGLSRHAHKLAKKVRTLGVRETLGLIWRNVKLLVGPRDPEESQFDRVWGLDTSFTIDVDELGGVTAPVTQANRYEPSSVPMVRGAVESLGIDYPRYTFVDIGSGKGRVILLASNYPFARIVGVEFSSQLCEIARCNVERYRPPSQLCHNIDLVHADATCYELPPGDLVLYLYNPFQGGLMERLAEHIAKSHQAQPRDILVIYTNPVEALVFESRGFALVAGSSRQRIYRLR